MNPEPPAWHTLALCARLDDVGAWFPAPGRNDLTEIAIETCGRCPVRLPCLRFALDTETPATRHGIWGGTTPTQRAQMEGTA